MKIAVLLSGGVDSSVALHLLAAQGHDLTAFYLKIWLEDERAFLGDCPWETDLGYARAVCADLDVPLRTVPLQAEYLDQVVSYALAELEAGRTPSPDIFCNQRIKFGAFYDRIDPDFDKVASGHYARIDAEGDRFLLKRAPDPVKDQTYFLSHLSQAQLGRALFPIGHLRKAQVRQLAARHGLATQDRKDSQGICFLGKISYRDFVSSHLGQRPGDIRELKSDRRLGPHQGYWFYTIGQRQGLGLSGGPWYVVGKNLEANIVYVSHKEHFTAQSRCHFTASRINWIAGPPDRPDLHVKLRHGPQLENCRIRPQDAVATDRLAVELESPDPGLAAGQHAVFYRGDVCLGGGIID